MDFSNLSWAPPEKVPGLLEIAQTPPDLPTNSTPEGEQAAQEYARHLQYARQMQYVTGDPNLGPDRNAQDSLATTGARYTGANNIAYEPPPEAGFGNMGGYYMDGQGAGPQAGGGGSGFYMGGKPVAMPQVQGDAGRQLGRLPPNVRDAFGPSVVQHILNATSYGGTGRDFPGSLGYMLTVPPFEAGDSFRLNRDAWGRGFGLGSSDMMHPPRPRP